MKKHIFNKTLFSCAFVLSMVAAQSASAEEVEIIEPVIQDDIQEAAIEVVDDPAEIPVDGDVTSLDNPQEIENIEATEVLYSEEPGDDTIEASDIEVDVSQPSMKSSLNREIPEDQNSRTTFRAKGFEGKGLIVEEYSNGANTYYNMTVLHGNYSIDSLPWGTPGYRYLGSTRDILGQDVTVVQESESGLYAEVCNTANGYLGWVDKRAFDYRAVKSYESTILYPGYSIDTKPWGTSGYTTKSLTDRYMDQTVRIVMEDSSGSYALAIHNGKELGWVDTRSLGDSFPRLARPYQAWVTSGRYSVDNKPWGSNGYRRLGSSKAINQRKVTVLAHSTEVGSSYSFIQVDGKNHGWVDNRALTVADYTAQVLSPKYSIDSKPWGERGFRTLGSSRDHLYQEVHILGKNSDGSYLLLANNEKILGWADHKAISSPYGTFATIHYRGYSLDTRPWGSRGFRQMDRSDSFLGRQVEVVGQSDDQSYVLIKMPSNRFAWVDYRAIRQELGPVVTLHKRGYSLDSRPWGTSGARTLDTTTNRRGEEVTLIDQSHPAYSLVQDRHGRLYWVDDRAFRTESREVTVRRGAYSIDSLPWGTHGYRNLGSASTYANRKVTVIGSHGSYRLIQIPGGKVLGWVDKRAIQLEGAARLLEEVAKYIDVIKYSHTHRQMVNAYNRVTPLPLGYTLQVSDDWCDAFVTYIGDNLGISSLIGRECGVERHKNIFRRKGIWQGFHTNPLPGDIITFHWGGQRHGYAHHIGFVESVKDGEVITIEGNTTVNNVSQVARKTYSLNSRFIQGYARPNYSSMKF